MPNEPKDAWDKFSIITTVIASVLLPLVIFIVGFWYTRIEDNRREDQKKVEQDNLNADRATQLLNHMASDNPRERCLALLFAEHLIENDLFPKELLPEIEFILDGVNDESNKVVICAAHVLTRVTIAKPILRESLITAAKTNLEVRDTVERAINNHKELEDIIDMKSIRKVPIR